MARKRLEWSFMLAGSLFLAIFAQLAIAQTDWVRWDPFHAATTLQFLTGTRSG